MGARREKSIKIALKLLIETVYTIWDYNKKNAVSLFPLDVARVFDHIFHSRLLHNLRSKGVPKYIIQ